MYLMEQVNMSEVNPSRRDNEEENKQDYPSPVSHAPPIPTPQEIGEKRRARIKKLFSLLKIPFKKFFGTDDGFVIGMGTLLIFLFSFFMFIISAVISMWFNQTFYGHERGSWIHIIPLTILFTVIGLLLIRFFFPEWFKES